MILIFSRTGCTLARPSVSGRTRESMWADAGAGEGTAHEVGVARQAARVPVYQGDANARGRHGGIHTQLVDRVLDAHLAAAEPRGERDGLLLGEASCTANHLSPARPAGSVRASQPVGGRAGGRRRSA